MMKLYLVSITNTFHADDAEHAIEQFVDHVLSSINLRSDQVGVVDMFENAIKASINDIEELEDES